MKKKLSAMVIFAVVFIIISICAAAKETQTITVNNGELETLENGGGTVYIFDDAAIKNDNSLWTWAYDAKSGKVIKEPKKISDNVSTLSGEGTVIKDDGSMWRWLVVPGNVPYEMGKDISYTNQTYLGIFCIKNNQSLWAMGYNVKGSLGIDYTNDNDIYIQEYVKVMNNVKKVCGGDGFALILKTDGSLWTCGTNSCGELGAGLDKSEYSVQPLKIMDDVRDIYTGYWSAYALKEDDSLWYWGYSGGTKTLYSPEKYAENVKAVAVGWNVDLVLDNDNSLYMYELDDNSEYKKITKIMDNVNDIYSNFLNELGNHSLILNNDGELFAFNITYSDELTIDKIMEDVKLKPDDISEMETNFIDITDENEKEAIKHLEKAGVITGTSDTEFSPDKTLTRAEIGAMLLRMTEHKYETADESVFSDVSKNDWFCGTSALCRNYGIINGYEDNTFRGNDEISKLQLIVLASRTLQNESARYNENVNTAAGIPIPDWAEDDVNTALAYGLIDEANLDNLENPITRSEAAVVLYKLYNLM